MDYTKATNVERVDMLEIQALNLRAQLLGLEKRVLIDMLLHKYGAPGDVTITVRNDGTIERSATALQPDLTFSTSPPDPDRKSIIMKDFPTPPAPLASVPEDVATS